MIRIEELGGPCSLAFCVWLVSPDGRDRLLAECPTRFLAVKFARDYAARSRIRLHCAEIMPFRKKVA